MSDARITGIDLEFNHVGAKCPACRYVYTNGFSSLTVENGKHERDVMEHPLGSLTLCTRCGKVLAVGDKGPVLLSDVDLMLLSDTHRAGLEVVRQLLRVTQGNVH